MIYGPFADLGPPQALVLKHDILANERRMMWRSGRALQAKPARAIRSRVGTTPADDVVAGTHHPMYEKRSGFHVGSDSRSHVPGHFIVRGLLL
jgi:hypothetical protein